MDREFVDKLSARSRADRPGLQACIDYLRGGDELQVASIDRLARSLVDLRQVIDQITAKAASVRFLKESLTFSAEESDPRSLLMLGVLGSFAEFERSIIRERQAEGTALTKKASKYTGRKEPCPPSKRSRPGGVLPTVRPRPPSPAPSRSVEPRSTGRWRRPLNRGCANVACVSGSGENQPLMVKFRALSTGFLSCVTWVHCRERCVAPVGCPAPPTGHATAGG